MLRRILAFVAAAAVMVVLGSAAHSYFVQRAWSIAAAHADGVAAATIPLADRLAWIAHDLGGMIVSYCTLTSIALLIAFLIAGAIARFSGHRSVVFGIAGAAAILVMFTALRLILGTVGVFGARGAVGLMAQMAAGLIAGLIFARLSKASKPQAFKFKGSAAAVTGAASGIGRALALEFARRGCDVALADLDAAGLEAVAKQIRDLHGRQATVLRVDVADPQQIESFSKAAITSFPTLNILVNNAGVALRGDFDEFDQAQMEWLMSINFWGVVRGTRTFLPHLQTRPQAHIVNISSIFGIIAPAGQSAYVASKFAVRGFSESLRHELAAKNSTVRLTVVHPGGIATNIARSARAGVHVREQISADEIGDRFAKVARTSPETAALRIIRGIERNEPRVLIGNDARLMDVVQRLRPATYWTLLMKAFERLSGANV
jgi:short-subunit dehydrogenase